MDDAATVSPVTFRTPANVALYSVGFGLLLLAFAGGIAESDSLPMGAFMFAGAIASLWFLVRAVRASVTVEGYGLRIRGYVRTRRLAWAEISNVDVEELPTIVPWRVPVLHLASGNSLRVPEVAQIGTRPGQLTRFIELLSSKLNER